MKERTLLSLFTACQYLSPSAGPVTEVTVTNCDDDSSKNCTLSCEGVGDGPLTYTWFDDGQTSSGSTLDVERKSQDVVYTCEVKNPVSQKKKTVTVSKLVHKANQSNSQIGQKAGQDVFVYMFIDYLVFIFKNVHVVTLQDLQLDFPSHF